MDLLKRHLAPIIPAAWDAIDQEAKRVLTLHLSGRKLVDFDGTQFVYDERQARKRPDWTYG